MPAGPLPPPSPPAAIATATQVEEAASTLVSILSAQGAIDEDTAQEYNTEALSQRVSDPLPLGYVFNHRS